MRVTKLEEGTFLLDVYISQAKVPKGTIADNGQEPLGPIYTFLGFKKYKQVRFESDAMPHGPEAVQYKMRNLPPVYRWRDYNLPFKLWKIEITYA